MQIEEHIPLAPWTTFRIGGPARFFARAKTIDDICTALAFVKEKGLPLFVLGGGSNILVGDDGFDGLVLHIELQGIELKEEHGEMLAVAEAGEPWERVVAHTVERGLWGIENLSGIPGTVGGAAVQNIGAYGMEIKDALSWLEALDRESGCLRRFSAAECDFTYRGSFFKKGGASRYVIVRAALRLSEHGKPNLSYRDMREAYARTLSPSAAEIRETILKIRSGKFPDLSKEGTAGSFFLNPVVSEEKASALAAQFPEMPQFPADGGSKVSLAYLLDKGLGMKGMMLGQARLFERQPLVLTAAFGSSAKDVEKLAAVVQEKISAAYDINIEPEVKII